MAVDSGKVGGKAKAPRSAIERALGTPQELRTLAQKHFQAGRYADAVATLDEAELTRPPTPASLKMRTLAFIKEGRAEMAALLLPKLLRVDRADEAWLRGLGRIAAKLNAWQSAVEVWSRVRALAPADPECLVHLLRAHAALGQHRSTLSASLDLLSIGSDSEEVLRTAAWSSAGLGHVHRAGEFARRLLERDHDRTYAWLARLEGPWWTLIAARLLLPRLEGDDLKVQRMKLLATGLSRGMSAESRSDCIAAYAAFRAAVAADETNADARDGVHRARTRLACLLAESGGAPDIAAHDALAAVFLDDELAENWQPLFERLAQEEDWNFAKHTFKDAVPESLLPAFLSRLKRKITHKRERGDLNVEHFNELYVMIKSRNSRF